MYLLDGSILSFVLVLSPLISSKYSEWEDIVPYCEIAPVRCSTERNDEAYMPYYNSSCYCDYFCFRHEDDHDCCPDFEDVCEPKDSTNYPVEKEKLCEWDGKQYGEGSSVLNDCNSCTCIISDIGPQWNCEHDLCGNNKELMESINKNGEWYASSYGRWSGVKYNAIKQYSLGTILDEKEKRRMDNYNFKDPDGSIYSFKPPTEWSVEQGRWSIGPVRDQGNCGSSWALSALDVASDRLVTNKHSEQLAVQYVLSCSEPQAKDSCRAGRVHYAWGFLKDFGAPQESDYPYESGRTGLIGYCAAGDKTWHKIEQFSPAYRVNSDPLIIKEELYTRGPVQATFLVCPDFYQYKDGVYSRVWNGPDSLCDYHSVRVIGWGTTHSAVTGEKIEYWLCINSWGTDWGENGRFKIKMGDSEINNYVISTWGRSVKKHN